MCRATNYFALIRKALVDAGYPQIPVIAISTQGFVDNPEFTPTVPLLHRAAKSLIIGDLLMKCLYRVRPYEANPGSANRLYERWNVIVRDTAQPRHVEDREDAVRARTGRTRNSWRRSWRASTRCRCGTSNARCASAW